MEIKGKVAIVTGGASGIGLKCVEELLKNGAKVSVCDVNAKAGEDLLRKWTKEYSADRVIFTKCDVSCSSELENVFTKTISTFGGFDIVMNNAGILNDAVWEKEVDINLKGTIRGTFLAMKHMSKENSGKGGIVVNTASVGGLKPFAPIPVYIATKHGVIGFTRSIGDKSVAARTGIRVVALCPDSTLTSIVDHFEGKSEFAELHKTFQTILEGAQDPVCVAKALLHVIKEAESGTAWVIKDGKPAWEVSFPEFVPNVLA